MSSLIVGNSTALVQKSTSVMSLMYKTFGGDLSELTPKEDLVKILECPVCQEIPLPPIYNCTKGHTICHKCRKRVTKCALCKAPFTDSRNFALESIVQTSKFSCDYMENGCPLILEGCHLRKHTDECEFRPMNCHLGRQDGCNHSSVEYSNYFEHLLGVHNILGGKEERDDTFVIRQTFTESIKNKHNWLCTYKKYNGRVFLTRSFKIGTHFYWSLALIGGDAMAANYSVKISLRSYNDDMPKYEITIPVISIRKSKAEIAELPHAMLTQSVLKYFCSISLTPDKKEKFQWQTQYQIITKNNQNPKTDSSDKNNKSLKI